MGELNVNNVPPHFIADLDPLLRHLSPGPTPIMGGYDHRNSKTPIE